MSLVGIGDTTINEYLNSECDDNYFLVDGAKVPLPMTDYDSEAKPRNLQEIGGIVQYLLSTPETNISTQEFSESPEYLDLTEDWLAQLLFSWGLYEELYNIFRGK